MRTAKCLQALPSLRPAGERWGRVDLGGSAPDARCVYSFIRVVCAARRARSALQTTTVGPRNLTLYATSFSPIIVGRGGYGYAFFDETTAPHPAAELGRQIRLLAIGANGGVPRTVGSAEGFLGVVPDIAERSFRLDTPTRPALYYRFEIEFRDHASGAVLGAYSEYLRVVNPTFQRVSLSSAATSDRGRVPTRDREPGDRGISFGVSYEIQRFDGGHWTRAPGGPERCLAGRGDLDGRRRVRLRA